MGETDRRGRYWIRCGRTTSLKLIPGRWRGIMSVSQRIKWIFPTCLSDSVSSSKTCCPVISDIKWCACKNKLSTFFGIIWAADSFNNLYFAPALEIICMHADHPAFIFFFLTNMLNFYLDTRKENALTNIRLNSAFLWKKILGVRKTGIYSLYWSAALAGFGGSDHAGFCRRTKIPNRNMIKTAINNKKPK